MMKAKFLICLLPLMSLTSCALSRSPETIDPIPGWLLVPIEVVDTMPPEATMRDVVAQALEYKYGLNECSARLDSIRMIQEGTFDID